MTTPTIDWDRLTLRRGSHAVDQQECDDPHVCLWEAINLDRRQELTDTCPADTSQTVYGFTIAFNDCLPDDRRQQLKSYRKRLIGTAGQPGADRRAAYLCVDWLIRTYTPAFLRLADLNVYADALAGAVEVTDLTTLAIVTDDISAARSAADSAARSVAYSAAYSVARSAAYSAADSVARSAANAALAPTVNALQDSAFILLDQMLDCYTQVTA